MHFRTDIGAALPNYEKGSMLQEFFNLSATFFQISLNNFYLSERTLSFEQNFPFIIYCHYFFV